MNDINIELMDGRDFEFLCSIILERFYKTKVDVTPLVNDKGKDLIIYDKNSIIFVECKHWIDGTIGRPVIQKLHSAIITEKADSGIVITSGKFSKEAKEYAKICSPKIELIDLIGLQSIAASVGYNIHRGNNENIGNRYCRTDDINSIWMNLKKKISENIFSYPLAIDDLIEPISDYTTYFPYYFVQYRVDTEVNTRVGTIYSVHKNGMYLINSNTLEIISDEYICNSVKNNISDDITHFKIHVSKEHVSTKSEILDHIKKHITRSLSKNVTYRGKNNQTYHKLCSPLDKDIFITDFVLIMVAKTVFEYDIVRKRHIQNLMNIGDSKIHPINKLHSDCNICGEKLYNNSILCLECGNIVHKGRLIFYKHGMQCSICGKTICINCAKQHRKYLIFKKYLCTDCHNIYSKS